MPSRAYYYSDRSSPQSYEPSHSPIRREEISPSRDDDYHSDEAIEKPEINYKFTSINSNVREFERETTPLRHKTPAPVNISSAKEETTRKGKYLLIIVVVLIIALFFSRSEKPKTNVSEKVNCSELMELKTQFPKQDNKLFKALKAGIEGTFNEKPSEPSVFSLFSTDQNLINNIMDKIIHITMQCINQTHDPIFLKKEHFTETLVADYKDELMKRNIMVINNVDEAPQHVVSSLHSFCDTYNPLVSKSIIFLTIKTPRMPTGKPIEYITEYLNNHWKNLPDNIRGPLITRMLDQTFFLNP